MVKMLVDMCLMILKQDVIIPKKRKREIIQSGMQYFPIKLV